jgi:hypothetical protein
MSNITDRLVEIAKNHEITYELTKSQIIEEMKKIFFNNEAISREAYRLWEKDGKPENKQLNHWFKAKKMLKIWSISYVNFFRNFEIEREDYGI